MKTQTQRQHTYTKSGLRILIPARHSWNCLWRRQQNQQMWNWWWTTNTFKIHHIVTGRRRIFLFVDPSSPIHSCHFYHMCFLGYGLWTVTWRKVLWHVEKPWNLLIFGVCLMHHVCSALAGRPVSISQVCAKDCKCRASSTATARSAFQSMLSTIEVFSFSSWWMWGTYSNHSKTIQRPIIWQTSPIHCRFQVWQVSILLQGLRLPKGEVNYQLHEPLGQHRRCLWQDQTKRRNKDVETGF